MGRLKLQAPESNSEAYRRMASAGAAVLAAGSLAILALKPRGIDESIRDIDAGSNVSHIVKATMPSECRMGQITVKSVAGPEGVDGGTISGIAATKTPFGPEHVSEGVELIAELNGLENPDEVVPGLVLDAPVDC